MGWAVVASAWVACGPGGPETVLQAPLPPGAGGAQGGAATGSGGGTGGFGFSEDVSDPSLGRGAQSADGWAPANDGTVGVGADPLGGECGYGTIFGVICSKNEQMYVNDAEVWVDATDCEGHPVHIATKSNENGYYTLEGVPNGYQTVRVQKGVFEHEYTVAVVAGQLTDVTAVGHKECFKAVGGECPTGAIDGYVCAPNETLFIGGATVSVDTKDCNGKPLKLGTLSGADGNYLLADVPAGQVEVHIQKGSFETSYVVNVLAGQTVHAADVVQDACFDEGETKIAVVTGDWDSIQNILNQLGIVYDLYDGLFDVQQTVGLLSDLQKMLEYDIIFFNCGGKHDQILLSASMAAMISNLQLYLAGGGSVYASDWAFVYVEWPWPAAIDFVGGEMNPFGPKVGASGTVIGTVTDPALSAALGKTQVDLNYDLSSWVVVQSAPASTEVHIVGDVPLVGSGVPLMLSHDQGGGKVLYTTFHNEPQITGDMADILKFLVFEL